MPAGRPKSLTIPLAVEMRSGFSMLGQPQSNNQSRQMFPATIYKLKLVPLSFLHTI